LAAVSPIFLIFFIAIFALIYFSWILNPISNLILKYDKFGKYLLTKDETKAVNIVSVGLILGVVFITVGVIFSSTFFYYLSFIAFTLIIPFSNYYDSDEEEQTPRFLYYCYGLAALVAISILIFFIDYNISFGFGIAYLIGVIAYTWVKPFLAKV
jgi:hypothetical protein